MDAAKPTVNQPGGIGNMWGICRDFIDRLVVQRELRRIKGAPRFLPLETAILGHPLTLADGLSFFYSYQEIMRRRIYDFEADNDAPRIIDGGANIGLSVLFFKQRYPNSRITAFEADPQIYELLRGNIVSSQCRDVELVKAALWSEAGMGKFIMEGADAGRMALGPEDDGAKGIHIVTTRLLPYLEQEMTDFLKLDIEGAEYEVLSDCADALVKVKNIFVEYHSLVGVPQRLGEILQILRSAGFRVYIHTQFSPRRPFLHRETQYGMDLQLNIFGIRS